MKTLGRLLGSAARTDILRTLVCQPGAVGLRQVARIAEVHPHSAELALAGLVREGLVRRRRINSRAVYEVNRSHADVAVLEAVFLAVARAVSSLRSRSLDERSKSILPFIRQATRMLAHARETKHVA
jgi:hypothetical protein